MSTINIDFEWSKGRDYEWAPDGGGVLWPKGKRFDRIRPIELPGPPLAFAFAKLDGSKEQFLAFARSFGLPNARAREGLGEQLPGLQQSVRKMRAAVEVVTAGRDACTLKIATLDVALTYGMPGTKPVLVKRPRSLFDAMLLQVAQSVASGNAIHVCAQCDNWFEAGGHGRRSVAKFCSRACKDRANYERRVKS